MISFSAKNIDTIKSGTKGSRKLRNCRQRFHPQSRAYNAITAQALGQGLSRSKLEVFSELTDEC